MTIYLMLHFSGTLNFTKSSYITRRRHRQNAQKTGNLMKSLITTAPIHCHHDANEFVVNFYLNSNAII